MGVCKDSDPVGSIWHNYLCEPILSVIALIQTVNFHWPTLELEDIEDVGNFVHQVDPRRDGGRSLGLPEIPDITMLWDLLSVSIPHPQFVEA
ncbi:hypothetical protein Aduo_018654 [Ancylostoma duodenale]